MNLDHNHLEKVWSSVVQNSMTAYDYKRIDGVCIPDLSLGVSTEGNRCLVLELPQENSVDFNNVEKKNLALLYFAKEKIIVLELKTVEFNSPFCDLVISLYNSIRDISNVNDYSQIFVKTFFNWSNFFTEKNTARLSDDAVKGLIGELLVLRKLLKGSSSSDIDLLLSAWKGPYDKGKDFELESLDIEIKTKNSSSLSVKISSEHQLNPNPGKDLQMWIVSVQQHHETGETLSSLIWAVYSHVIERNGDIYIYRKALWQKGLTPENSSGYDSLKFIPKFLSKYDCLKDGFPSLRASSLNPALSKIRYHLNLLLIDKFLIAEEHF